MSRPSITFVHAWERTVFHGADIFLNAVGHAPVHVGKMAQELRLEAPCHAQGVGIDEDLPVGLVAGADADGGTAPRLRHLGSQLGGHLLQRDGEAAGFIKCACVGQESLGLGRFLGTKAVAPELMHALGRKS